MAVKLPGHGAIYSCCLVVSVPPEENGIFLKTRKPLFRNERAFAKAQSHGYLRTSDGGRFGSERYGLNVSLYLSKIVRLPTSGSKECVAEIIRSTSIAHGDLPSTSSPRIPLKEWEHAAKENHETMVDCLTRLEKFKLSTGGTLRLFPGLDQ